MKRAPRAANAEQRAADLHRAALAANEDMRPGGAATLLRRALTVLDSQPPTATSRLLRGRILITLAVAEAELGDVERGFALLDEAERLLQGDERAVLHAQRAILLRRTGRDVDALPEYAAALRLLDADESPLLVAKVLLNRAVLHTAGGRVAAARSDLLGCRELASRIGDEALLAKADHNLGFLAWTTGDLPAALRHYEQAEVCYRVALPGNLAMLSLDRARVLLAAGLPTEADVELAAAVPELRRQRSGQDQAEGLLARAEAALLAGQPARAGRFARQAEGIFSGRGNHRWAGRAALLGVQAAEVSGRVAPSVLARRADTVQSALDARGLPSDAQLAALVAARAHLAAGDLDVCRQLLAHAGRPTSGNVRVYARLVRSELASRQGRRVEAQRQRRAVLSELDRLRSSLGALDLRAGTAILGTQVAQAGLASAVATGRASGILAWAELTRAQSLLLPPLRPDTLSADWEQLRAATLTQLRAELDGTDAPQLRSRRDELRWLVRRGTWSAAGGGATERPVTLLELRARLGEACLVAYLHLGDRLKALAITGDQHRLVSLGRLGVARERLLRLRADLTVLSGRDDGDSLYATLSAAFRADAAALSDQLLEPLLPVIGDRALVVVPTADLITVPWGVLPAARGRPVTVTPSATLWARRAQASGAARGSVLLASGPRLPNAAAELSQIADLARQAGVSATVLPGATTAAVTRALAEHDLAHLACHGHHVFDNPLFSSLELSDGLLMGYDLLALPRPPRTVVLSACDLGITESRPGDESLGIATALLAAGTQSVIANVAQTGDAATTAIMTEVHSGMLAGRTPAQALASALAGRPSGFICMGAG